MQSGKNSSTANKPKKKKIVLAKNFPPTPGHFSNTLSLSCQIQMVERVELLNISTLHVQYGIQGFAKFKCPECTRLPLRELQSKKFSWRNMHLKLQSHSQSGWALSRPHIVTVYYISRPPPTSFPGSLSYPSRDRGWVWSRVSQNLGDYKQTFWGRGG